MAPKIVRDGTSGQRAVLHNWCGTRGWAGKIPNSEFLIPNSHLYTYSVNDLLSPPLARWDGLHLVLDLGLVERHLNELLSAREDLRDLALEGEGDGLAAEATVVWRGVPARVGLEVAEIRLRHRHIGFRMRKIRALGGLPVPRTAVELALTSLNSSLLSVFSGHGIVVVDLRRWLPEELMLEVLTVQGTTRSLHLWFGPGSLANLPGQGPRLLPAETETD